MNIEHLTALIIAVIGSGGVSSAIATLLAARKHKAEIEQLMQQVESDKADTKIKIEEHIQKQMIELNNTYKEEFEKRRQEIEELHEANANLRQQVETLSTQINQLMSWVVYDSMRYQEWLEDELIKRDPDIQFPTFRKPPRFVNNFIAEESLKTNLPMEVILTTDTINDDNQNNDINNM